VNIDSVLGGERLVAVRTWDFGRGAMWRHVEVNEKGIRVYGRNVRVERVIESLLYWWNENPELKE